MIRKYVVFYEQGKSQVEASYSTKLSKATSPAIKIPHPHPKNMQKSFPHFSIYLLQLVQFYSNFFSSNVSATPFPFKNVSSMRLYYKLKSPDCGEGDGRRIWGDGSMGEGGGEEGDAGGVGWGGFPQSLSCHMRYLIPYLM